MQEEVNLRSPPQLCRRGLKTIIPTLVCRKGIGNNKPHPKLRLEKVKTINPINLTTV
jgi:hypothetical protein